MRQVLLAIGFLLSITSFAQQQIVIKCPECGHAIKVSFSVDGSAIAVHDSTSVVAISGLCKAKTAKGTQCSRKAQDGSEYCWQHASKTEARQTTTTTSTLMDSTSASGGRCRATTKSGSRCTRTARSNGYCWQHGG